jgi:signal transduction histidine kinase
VMTMRAEARQLESLVEQRTSELRKQKEHLEHSQRFIEKSNLELKKLNESQRYMLGVAAHDMRNPLGNIRALSKELRKELDSELGGNHPGIETLRLIEQSSSDLLDLVEGVVQSSTLDASDMVLSYEQENLTELLHSVIESNQSGARQKGQIIRVEADGDLIASADALQMRSAMDNFLSNAIKYSPKKGMIEVELKAVADERIRMAVRDQGPGLSDEDMTRVFGKFTRLSARPTAGESSAGMGLAIVKQVITLHGGEVGVQNRIGGGAEFWLEIPMKQGDPGREASLGIAC